MSPGFAVGIFGFMFVQSGEHRGGGQQKLVIRPLRQFCQNFSRTDGKQLTLLTTAGKRLFLNLKDIY